MIIIYVIMYYYMYGALSKGQSPTLGQGPYPRARALLGARALSYGQGPLLGPGYRSLAHRIIHWLTHELIV